MNTLQFSCQPACTNCCRTKGYVYLTEDDILRAAAFLHLTPEEFERRYVYRTRYTRRLRKPKHEQCHFLHAQGCDIHPAKPTQCRTFPFWPELVESREAWEETRQRCPGIGTGQLFQIGTVLETADEMRRAYPELYGGS